MRRLKSPSWASKSDAHRALARRLCGIAGRQLAYTLRRVGVYMDADTRDYLRGAAWLAVETFPLAERDVFERAVTMAAVSIETAAYVAYRPFRRYAYSTIYRALRECGVRYTRLRGWEAEFVLFPTEAMLLYCLRRASRQKYIVPAE